MSSTSPSTGAVGTSTSSSNASSSGVNSSAVAAVGNALWQKQNKANAELFALTYGAMVAELLRDLERKDKIQEELDRMGHSMGVRCVEEFLSKAALEPNGLPFTSALAKNRIFIETAHLIKASFKMFLGVAVDTTVKSDHSYTLSMVENPLILFVELPPPSSSSSSSSDGNANNKSASAMDYSDLEYSQLLCGMVRGILEMLQYDVTCTMIQSQLKGAEINEMLVDLKQVLQEGAGEDYHEE